MARAPKTFAAYLTRRKQTHYIYATIWLAMVLFWLVFPGLVERGGRYGASIKFVAIAGLPMWIAINYMDYRGWFSSRKRTKMR
ncbi:MAG: hypothetical protein AAF727_09835 [Pseudomonadota bacterium]